MNPLLPVHTASPEIERNRVNRRRTCRRTIAVVPQRRLGAWAALLILAVTATMSGHAAPVVSRAALGGTDFLDWAQLGPDQSLAPPVVNVLSHTGLSATLKAFNAGNIARFDQGVSWFGNFAANDALVFHEAIPAAPVAFDIDFDFSVSAVGTQLQRALLGAFVGTIAVFGADGAMLEQWEAPGISDAGGDNVAVFVGIERAEADIRSVRFRVESTPEAANPFAMNRVDFRRAGSLAPNPTPVSEPGSWALIGLGIALLLMGRGGGSRRS